MYDKKNSSSGNVGSGSSKLFEDTDPLAIGETRTSDVIGTRACGKIGIDIAADQPCNVKIVRLPDGVTPGKESDVGEVTAGTPEFFLYSSIFCPAIKVVVTNTGSAAMTTFAMYVRGGA